MTQDSRRGMEKPGDPAVLGVRHVFGILSTLRYSQYPAPPSDGPCGSRAAPPPRRRPFRSRPDDRPLPINLPTACNCQRQPDRRGHRFTADRAGRGSVDPGRVLWLPYRLPGGRLFSGTTVRFSDAPGNVVGSSKSSLMLGAGPSMVFAPPTRSSRRWPRGRSCGRGKPRSRRPATIAFGRGGSLLQRPAGRGDLAGAEDVLRRADDVLHRAQELQKSVISELEVAGCVPRRSAGAARSGAASAGASPAPISRASCAWTGRRS